MHSKAKNFKDAMYETSLVWNSTSINNMQDFCEKSPSHNVHSGNSMGMFSTKSCLTNVYLSEADFFASTSGIQARRANQDTKKFLICPICFTSLVFFSF